MKQTVAPSDCRNGLEAMPFRFGVFCSCFGFVQKNRAVKGLSPTGNI